MSVCLNKVNEGERLFIINGVDLNIRSDGRSCLDYRTVMIEQNVIETCSGSAHVRSGNTDVLVGIKLETTLFNDNNENKRVRIFADISPIASPAFEGKKSEDITCQIEELFSDFLPNYLDLEKLIIVPNKSYFLLQIDIVILECSSLASLIDITSIAIKTALYDVRIPKIQVLSTDQNEFTVSEDEYDTIQLDASQVPLVTSYTKIGSKFVIDTTWEEEQTSVGIVLVGFVPPNQIVLVKKIRYGSIRIDFLPSLCEIATKFGFELSQKLNAKFEQKNLKKDGKITFSLN